MLNAAARRTRRLLGAGLAVLALWFPSVAAAAPPNDSFANAQELTGASVTTAGSNEAATGEAGEPDHAFSSLPLASAWYRWTATASGLVRASTCEADFDTTLGVYTGAAVDALGAVTSSDDGLACGNRGSSAVFDAVAGETYRIAVDGFEDAEGSFTLRVGPVTPPANDAFASATTLTGREAFAGGSTLAATAEPGEPDHAGVSSPVHSAWYRWTAPESATVFIDTCFADFDTTLAVYTGAPVSALTQVAANDDGDFCEDVTSDLSFAAVTGVTYSIAVAGFEGEQGDFAIALFQDDPAPPPPPPPPPPTTTSSAPAAASAATGPRYDAAGGRHPQQCAECDEDRSRERQAVLPGSRVSALPRHSRAAHRAQGEGRRQAPAPHARQGGLHDRGGTNDGGPGAAERHGPATAAAAREPPDPDRGQRPRHGRERGPEVADRPPETLARTAARLIRGGLPVVH